VSICWRARSCPGHSVGKAAPTIVGRVEVAIGSTRLRPGTPGRIADVAVAASAVTRRPQD